MSPLAVTIAGLVGKLITLAMDIVHTSSLTLEEKQKVLAQVVVDVNASHARAQATELRELP